MTFTSNFAGSRRLVTCSALLACVLMMGCSSLPSSRPGDLAALASQPDAGAPTPAFSALNPDEVPELIDPNAPFVQHTYRLGVGDTLRIVGDLDFLRGFGETSEGQVEGTRVKEDGNIYMPRIGAVLAAGKTALEVQMDLQAQLTKFDKNAYVSVDVLEYRSQKFFVMGALERPGPYPIDNSVTVLEGVAMAGGADEEAMLDMSYIVRGSRVLPVSLRGIYGGDLRQNIKVKHGDLFYVPSVTEAEVYVLGHVKRPAAIPFQKRMSLVKAIAAAGGLSDKGEKNIVRVFRGNLCQPRAFTVTLCDALRAGPSIRLHPGDRVYIGESADAEYDRVLKLVSPLLQGVSLAAVTAKTLGD